MTPKVIYGIIGGLVLLVVGYFVGLITGMNIGGNYLTTVEFAGLRGYEAMGILGGIIGAISGGVLGVFMGVTLADRRNK